MGFESAGLPTFFVTQLYSQACFSLLELLI